MSDNIKDENSELLSELISTVQKKNDSEKVDNSVKSKQARAIGVDDETHKVFVYFLDDIEEKEYTFLNKTGEIISVGDTVKVFYTSNPAKGWIGERCGEPNIKGMKIEQKAPYISAKVQNTTNVKYDKFERGILSVDFNVDGTDSDVVFNANQMCLATADGDVTAIYKVDGATQSYKLVENMPAGKRVMSHIYPMSLNKGKHNFALYVTSGNGSGTFHIGGLIGTISGQISGLKERELPNDDLIFYYQNLPAGEFTLPENIVYDSKAKKYIDWGDGSEIEESTAKSAVSHTYENGGDYFITIKTDVLTFGNEGSIVDITFVKNLSRIYFPDKTTSINFSFGQNYSPSNLEVLRFGNEAIAIKWYTYSSNKITSLILPETVATLFYEFSKMQITSLVIPSSVVSISGASAIKIPATLRTLERYDSVNCGLGGTKTGLGTLIIGGNATTAWATDCKALTKVEFPEPTKVTSIKSFEGCSALPEIILPKDIISIGNRAFYGCSSLKNIDIPKGVTALGERTFENCKSLVSANLPGLTEIGIYCFSGDNSLEKVGLAEGLTKISERAFYRCSSLSNITFPSTLTYIGAYAFDGYTGTQNNSKPFSPGMKARITYVGKYAFQYSGITEFYICGNTNLGEYAFYDCEKLANLEIEEGLPTIPNHCFDGTSDLGVVTLPSSLRRIENYAFRGSSIVTQLNDGLEYIGAEAFSGCSILNTNLVIPSSVTELGYEAFYNCDNIVDLTIEGNPLCGRYTFASCDTLTSIDISNLKNISDYMFYNCGNLRNIKFGTGITIGESAFTGAGNNPRPCAITSLPNFLSIVAKTQSADAKTAEGGIYKVGSGAFRGCKELTSVDKYEFLMNVYEETVDTEYEVDTSGDVPTNKKVRKSTTYSGEVVTGIYGAMKATTNSVFANTGLKRVGDIPYNKTTDNTYEEVAYYDSQGTLRHKDVLVREIHYRLLEAFVQPDDIFITY